MNDQHPLDPLTAEEITQAIAVLRENNLIRDSFRFYLLTLDEPAKELVRNYVPGQKYERRAFISGMHLDDKIVHEGLVSLTESRLLDWKAIPGVELPIFRDEFQRAQQVLRAHPDWIRALAKRNLDNAQVKLMIDSPHQYVPNQRIGQFIAYLILDPADNFWAHPIGGLMARVDLIRLEVLEVIDTGPMPMPLERANFDPESLSPSRTDLRPLTIAQPEGPSFNINGQLIEWQKWRLRFALDPIEGLVLYQIAYRDDGRYRPIIYRASIAEMITCYAGTGVTEYWRNTFDANEYGLGNSAQTLTLGCDCLGAITYIDAVLTGQTGEPTILKNVICIHEEDAGVAWKRGLNPAFPPQAATRRSRRLVLSTFVTAGNYDYGFYWYFYTDGKIQFEVKMTGLPFAVAVPADGKLVASSLIAPNLAAPHHQHFFCCRLDVEVDGPLNSVVEVDVEPVESANENPNGNSFVTHQRVLTHELDGQRTADASRARHWRIENPDIPNRLGLPTAYKLVSGPTALLMAQPTAHIARLAQFAKKNLWITAFDPQQRYPSGRYPTTGNEGLPYYCQQNRQIANADIVLWHCFSSTHIVRPEDWPIMPVESTGFSLLPVGFFDRNPALDLPQ